MVNLLRGIFSTGVLLILLALMLIIFGWFTFASIVGVIGAILALVGYVPMFLVWCCVTFRERKEINNEF